MSSGFQLSSSLKEEINNQGIVTILDSHTNSNSSLRRTLSADMSSKKWQIQNGVLSPLKKVASSDQFPVTISDQEEKKPPGEFDVWSSILAQKIQQDTNNLPPPYIHPLLKRSTSSLTKKGLEICTESLGSETGSDCFSSEASDLDQDDKEEEHERGLGVMQENEFEEHARVVTYKTERMAPRSFPPPIRSLSSCNGASMHMSSVRDNGRLVLKAVSVASQNNFHAQRQDGRLVLMFANSPDEKEEQDSNGLDQFEMEINDRQETEEEENETEEYEEVNKFDEEESGVLYFHRLALMMNKGTNKFAKMANFNESVKPLTQSLPPLPPVVPRMISSATVATAATASFNPYEYYWKPKKVATATSTATAATTSSIFNPIKNNSNKFILSKTLVATNDKQSQREVVVLRGQKGDYQFVPMLRSCKEPRMSLIFWEPRCIATS